MKSASRIFIHSSFRTASTWLWSRFRANRGCYAFYEIFGDTLEKLTIDDVARYRADGWRSNHPEIEPYFLEYVPLLRNGGGVDAYAPHMAIARYIPDDGLDGPISEAERSYVERLIACARARERIPVLSDTRTLGRMRSLKNIFGGWHIFSHRGIWRQWLSFLDQARGGNMFFITALIEAIRSNAHDGFLMTLHGNLRPPASGDALLQDADALEALFQAFFGFHIYLYMNAVDCADQIVDIGRLARDDRYRIEMEELLRLNTGLAISLAGARAHAVSPLRLSPESAERLAGSLPGLMERASNRLARMGLGPNTAFGEALTMDVLKELHTHQAGTVVPAAASTRP